MTKEKLRKKIKALLEKTTENGATKEEAMLALQKAEQLMQLNELTKEEIQDEVCVLKSTDRAKTKYREVFITGYLSKLFFTQTYYSKNQIHFFGFEEDVELCIYFYHFIIDSCLNDLEAYKNSTECYVMKKAGENGHKINSNFVKGYLIAVAKKIQSLYLKRQQQKGGEGIVVVEQKENKVAKAFSELNLNLRSVREKQKVTSESFNSGKSKGSELNIRQGVNDAKKASIKQISS